MLYGEENQRRGGGIKSDTILYTPALQVIQVGFLYFLCQYFDTMQNGP